jgi:tyrosine-specific transport protein
MLALPIVAHGMGMALAAVAMIALWALMTYTGLMMLEVCLAFPPGTEFGEIGRTLFGPKGGAAVNGVALAMLYAFSASFISAAGSTYGVDLSAYLGWNVPPWVVSIGYTVIIGVVVFSGGRRAAAANRVFFAINLTLLAALVVSIAPSVHLDNLYRSGPELAWMWAALPVFMTAYTYHTTIPTMLTYAGTASPRSLRKVFIVANLIALVTYLVWIFVALGALPQKGAHSFAEVERAGRSVGVFLHQIDAVGHNAATPNLFNAFSSTILITTYLATALALQDVLRGVLRYRFAALPPSAPPGSALPDAVPQAAPPPAAPPGPALPDAVPRVARTSSRPPGPALPDAAAQAAPPPAAPPGSALPDAVAQSARTSSRPPAPVLPGSVARSAHPGGQPVARAGPDGIVPRSAPAAGRALGRTLSGPVPGRFGRVANWPRPAKRAVLALACFVPPLAAGLAFQGAFVQLLSFSSIFAASLSILFPVAALHRLRSEGARRAGLKLPSYRVFVFWGMYVLVFECGALLVVFQIFTMLGALKS